MKKMIEAARAGEYRMLVEGRDVSLKETKHKIEMLDWIDVDEDGSPYATFGD
jgi:hypothetical protein